ncbi:hypothetical protein K7432_016681 [Basidiobolus ranarum]|uniref:Uncharacterized protein n=1 Tax=Basidiobolus ranarum TaxID=34480 RepID=A0ABR2VLK9_9FUNG
MRYTTLIGGIIAFVAIDVQAAPVLNKSKNAPRNTTIPPMPKGWMNDEFGVTSDVATAFADALTTLFVNYQNKDPNANNVGLTYWVHRNGMDGGNMYLGLQLSNPEDGYPYLGSIMPVLDMLTILK